MNRTIWIARALALILLIVFTIVMLNLYLKLQKISADQKPRPAKSSRS